MNRLTERALLAGTKASLLLLIAAGCSSNSDPATGSAGAAALPGAGSSALGNAGASGAGVISGGGASGAGVVSSAGASGLGSSSAGGGGVHSTAGASGMSSGGASTGGASGAGDATDCSVDPNLVKATDCWVGCDPALSTDNPMGLQGAFYTFGDDFSCTPSNPPCTAQGVCLSGTTAVDKTYTKWGCGMGLELNSSGGEATVKQPYAGAASCFNYTLSGSSGGNEVRIAFTQSADTTGKVSPYVSVPAFTNGKSGTVCLKDVSCQGQMNCTVGTTAYDLQVEVVGGNNAGAYNVCLTSLVPVSTGTSTLSQLCGAQGATNATADVGKYFAQNNVFPGGNNSACITPALKSGAAAFTVDSAVFATGATLNAYPSIVDGWHYGRMSTDSALPKQISALVSANSSVSYTGTDGKYDAAYDMWVLPNKPTTATKTPSGGLEIMMWLNSAGVSPAGNDTHTTFMGWEVWTGTVMDWKYVAYVKNGQNTFTGDLAPFVKNAVTVSNLPTTSWFSGIEFGFELYDYPGTGFAVTSFTADVK